MLYYFVHAVGHTKRTGKLNSSLKCKSTSFPFFLLPVASNIWSLWWTFTFHITNYTLHREILQIRIQITPDLLLRCDLSWVLGWWSSDYCLSRLCWTVLSTLRHKWDRLWCPDGDIYNSWTWHLNHCSWDRGKHHRHQYIIPLLKIRWKENYPVYMYVHLWSSLIHFMAPKFCQYFPIFHSCLFKEVKAVCSWCSPLEKAALITL